MQAITDLQRQIDQHFASARQVEAAPKEPHQADADAKPERPGEASFQQDRDALQSLAAKLDELRSRVELLGRLGQTKQGLEIISTELSIGILAFGAIVVTLEFVVLLRAGRTWGELDFKILATTLVVLMGVFLVVAGFSQEQITPVIGLLGAIVGYVLGKESFKRDDSSTEANGEARRKPQARR